MFKKKRDREIDNLLGKIRASEESHISDRVYWIDEYAKVKNASLDKDIEIANLKAEITVIENSMEDEVEERVRENNLSAESLIEERRLQYKKDLEKEVSALETEYKKKISSLEEDHLVLEADFCAVDGKYQGALEIIKNLKDQVSSLITLNKNLTEKLPSVSANIKSAADNNVSFLK
jgi:hypothetical protein